MNIKGEVVKGGARVVVLISERIDHEADLIRLTAFKKELDFIELTKANAKIIFVEIHVLVDSLNDFTLESIFSMGIENIVFVEKNHALIIFQRVFRNSENVIVVKLKFENIIAVSLFLVEMIGVINVDILDGFSDQVLESADFNGHVFSSNRVLNSGDIISH